MPESAPSQPTSNTATTSVPPPAVAWARRIHRSTVVFCAVWSLLFILLLVRGENTASSAAFGAGPSGGGYAVWEVWEHGWPKTYLVRDVDKHASRGWSIFAGTHQWLWTSLVYDIGVLAAIGLFGAAIWELAARRGMSFARFKLRTLLVAVTVCAFGLGWWCYELRLDRDEAIRARAIDPEGYVCEIDYVGPLLLRRFLGAMNPPGHRVTTVQVGRESSPAEIERLVATLPSFRSLQQVDLDGLDDPDRLDRIAKLLASIDCVPELSAASFVASNKTVESFASMKHLRYLNLEGTQITDASLRMLSQCKSLEVLRVGEDHVTDAGILYLPSYPRLIELDASGTAVSDASLRVLAQCKSLQMVNVSGTKVTREGIVWLKRERPELAISSDFE